MDKKTKLFYNGEAVVDICADSSNTFKYNSITSVISAKKKANPSLTEQDIIDDYFGKKHKEYMSITINGYSVPAYCAKVGKSSQAFYKRLSRARKDPKNEGKSKEEIVSDVIMAFFFDISGPHKLKELIIDDVYTKVLKPKKKKSE